MGQEKVFVLTNKRQFRRSVNIYVINGIGKQEKRNIVFSTERLVDPKVRSTTAKLRAAEYEAKNDAEYQALLSSSAYGITFVLKSDPEGKLKLPTRYISAEDAEKAALKLLFDSAGLVFNPAYDVNVLKKQYEIHVYALAGTNKITQGKATSIPSNPVDVKATIQDGVINARNYFKEKYGYDVPEIVENDYGFLSAVYDPGFDAEKYIAKKTDEAMTANKTDESGSEETEIHKPEKPVDKMTLEELQKLYFEKFGVNPSNIHKNNVGWLKIKLAE